MQSAKIPFPVHPLFLQRKQPLTQNRHLHQNDIQLLGITHHLPGAASDDSQLIRTKEDEYTLLVGLPGFHVEGIHHYQCCPSLADRGALVRRNTAAGARASAPC